MTFLNSKVQIFDLSSDELSSKDALVMATDGLWDVLSNKDVRELWAEEMALKPSSESK